MITIQGSFYIREGSKLSDNIHPSVHLPYIKTDPRAIEPTRAHDHDAGLDLYALEDLTLRPGEVKKVKTGIHIALVHEQVGLYWDKSGRASKGLTILGGCIDGPYRGELEVVVSNVNMFNTIEMMRAFHMETDQSVIGDAIKAASLDVIHVPYGKAVTQFLVVSKIEFLKMKEVPRQLWDMVYADTPRGEKGFGSSDQEIIRFIDGPLSGATLFTVPKEIVYSHGQRYKRVKDTLDYINAPDIGAY